MKKIEKKRMGELEKLPAAMITKLQALFRGIKARKEVQQVYGFKCKPSLMHRKTVVLSPRQMNQRRQSVAKMRSTLPQFEHNDDAGPGLFGPTVEEKPETTLPDGTQYTGEWDVS